MTDLPPTAAQPDPLLGLLHHLARHGRHAGEVEDDTATVLVEPTQLPAQVARDASGDAVDLQLEDDLCGPPSLTEADHSDDVGVLRGGGTGLGRAAGGRTLLGVLSHDTALLVCAFTSAGC